MARLEFATTARKNVGAKVCASNGERESTSKRTSGEKPNQTKAGKANVATAIRSGKKRKNAVSATRICRETITVQKKCGTVEQKSENAKHVAAKRGENGNVCSAKRDSQKNTSLCGVRKGQ